MYNDRGTYVPGEHQTVAVAPFLRGERKFLFSPFESTRGEVVRLYVTLVELLMILSLLIALADYLDNRRR